MLAALELEPVFARGNDLLAGVHRNPALAEDTRHSAARAVASEDGQLAEQREFRGDPGKRVPHGKEHLDSGRAASDHRDAPDLAPPRPLAQALPAREKRLDGADAERVLYRAGRLAGARPGVERQDVVVKTLAPGRGHLAPRGIDADRRILEKARTRARGERPEIDAAIPGPVVPRDDAGNHARVERVAIRTQQGKVNAFGRRIAEAFQYSEVAVPSADEKKMFHRVLEGCWVILTGVIHFVRFVSQKTDHAQIAPTGNRAGEDARALLRRDRGDEECRHPSELGGIYRPPPTQAARTFRVGARQRPVRRRPLRGGARQRLGPGQDADPREAPCETSSLIRGRSLRCFTPATSTTRRPKPFSNRTRRRW